MFLKGELQNLEAEVADVRDDGKVIVLPKIDGFTDPIDCDPEELKKFFQVRLGPCSFCEVRVLHLWIGPTP